MEVSLICDDVKIQRQSFTKNICKVTNFQVKIYANFQSKSTQLKCFEIEGIYAYC